MATTKLMVRGTKNPSPLYLRFINGRHFDVCSKTGIVLNPEHWDNLNGRFRNLKEIPNKIKITSELNKLQVDIVDRYNTAMIIGETTDKRWLDDSINSFFNRTKQAVKGKSNKHLIYYVEFSEWWLENKSKEWKTGKNKYIDHKAIQQYNSFLQIWKKFEGKKNYRINEIDCVVIGKFIDFAQDLENYSSNTVKRWVGRLRFFLLRAKTFELKTAPDFQDRVYVGKEHEIIKPYLNEDEINRIFNLDFSDNPEIDACRDYLIISCYTGLRVGDLLYRLGTSNINQGYIEIKTQKTGSIVKIPIHPKVKYILEKRFGNLPEKITESTYNKKIKKICNIAGINEMIIGKVYDKNLKRGVVKTYPKYKLITSHVGRRTFSTLLSGKLPKEAIAAIGGWKQVSMVDFYNKTTKTDYANALADFWKKEI